MEAALLTQKKVGLDVGVFTDKGNKSSNQDRFVCFPDLSSLSTPEKNFPFRKHFYAMFAIYDGHGGDFSAEFLKTHLHHNIVEELSNVKDFSVDSSPDSAEHIEYIKNVLVNAFHRADQELLEEQKRNSQNDGSTALVVLVVDQVAWVANTGDSKALLVRERENGKLKIRVLCRDHNPNYLNERRRIEKFGGFVKNGRVLEKLAVSRSFGDPTLKQYGVISTPNLSRVVLNPEKDAFLLLGCDGLWTNFPPEAAAKFAHKKFTHFSQPTPQEISRGLAKKAVIDRQTSDNVTVLTVAISKPENEIKKGN